MTTLLDPKGDYVFKRICGDEDNALLLVNLLNAVLGFPPGPEVKGVELQNPFVAKDYAQGKVSILDVLARDDLERLFHLEMQQLRPPAFRKRLLYYWSRGYSSQMTEGQRYELLQPCYSICFLNATLFDDDDFYHHTFRVRDDEHGILLCPDLEMHVIELSKFNVPVEQVKTQLERWCYFFKHGASLDLASLPATLDDPVIRKAVEVLVAISQNERERQWALERQRAERDAANILETAQVAQEQLKRGLEDLRGTLEELRGVREELRGVREEAKLAQEEAKLAQEEAKLAQEEAKLAQEEGFEKGKHIGRIQLLQQLLQQATTPSEELAQLPDKDLSRLAEALTRQISGNKQDNGPPPTDKA
jgi:predicted transposase/invertase (TIGR01784 family)